MVTRSRAREGRGISVVPETQFGPEQEIPEPQVSITTCERGLGAVIPSTIETASQYITADTPEITDTFTSQEINSSLSTENTQTASPHTGSQPGLISLAGRSATLSDISRVDTSMPTLSLHGDVRITCLAAHALASTCDTAFAPLFASARDARV